MAVLHYYRTKLDEILRMSTILFFFLEKRRAAKDILVIGAPGIKTYRKNRSRKAAKMLTVLLHSSYCLIIIASLQNHKLRFV